MMLELERWASSTRSILAQASCGPSQSHDGDVLARTRTCVMKSNAAFKSSLQKGEQNTGAVKCSRDSQTRRAVITPEVAVSGNERFSS